MSNENLNPNATLDDLLDGTLDDLADVPSFAPFPIGAHLTQIGWKLTTVNDIPSVELNLSLIEHVELTNPEDKPFEKGSKTNTLFMLKKKDDDGKMVRNDLAEGQWKALLGQLRDGLGLPPETTNREVMAKSEGLEVMAITGIRENKKDKNNVKYYTEVKSLTVPG